MQNSYLYLYLYKILCPLLGDVTVGVGASEEAGSQIIKIMLALWQMALAGERTLFARVLELLLVLLASGRLWLMWRFAWEKWGSVIREGQSHSYSSSRSQPWNPARETWHFRRKENHNFSFCLKIETRSALCARPARRRGDAETGALAQTDSGPASYSHPSNNNRWASLH